jgi:two-component system sensor histidine kinase TctE
VAPRWKPLPYSALEAFEADNRSRLYYKVSGFEGEMVSGFDDLPPPRADSGVRHVYAALVDFYDDGSAASRCAWRCCCSRWPAPKARAWPPIQVAETLELRQHPGAPACCADTLWQQACC